MKKSLLLLLSCCIISMGTSCDKNNDEEDNTDPCATAFDQEAMFKNIADNIIVPTYQELNEKVATLSANTLAFLNNTDAATLANLQEAFQQTYITWQKAAQYEFGPAETVFLRNSFNNFPLDIAVLQENIATQTYELNDPNRYDKGLPALDYLLYAYGDSTLFQYTTANDAENRKQYVADLVADMAAKANQVNDAWNGNYKDDFIQNTGTEAGTSLSLIINNLNQNYELIKREKLGIPSGVLTLGFLNPDKVEAYYSGISVDLATTALKATEQLYLGKSNAGVDGLGLDDYLAATGAQKNEQLLDDVIQAQFTNALNALNDLANPLSNTVEEDTDAVITAYNEVTKQLINIKTDMPSVLCVSITYIDNPSDSD